MSSQPSDVLGFYAAHGIMSDPREQADLLQGLPVDLPSLCGIVQGLLIHRDYAALYAVDLSKVQRKDAHIRPAADMLRLLRRLDSHPLTQARSAGERISATGRDFALMLCSLLRQQGRPARLRPGYVTYLGEDLLHDQWICEVWNPADGRWQRVDAQLDDIQRKAFKIDFDPCDIPPQRFSSAAQAWQVCRAGKAKSGSYGRNRKERGWNHLRTSLVQELAALNKIEVLPLDRWWELAARQDDQVSPEDMKLLDRAATSIAGLDETFDELRAAYEDDPRFGLAAQTKMKLLGLVGETGAPRQDAQPAAEQADGKAKGSFNRLPSDRERLASMRSGGASLPNGAKVESRLANDAFRADDDLDWIVVRGAQMHNLKHVDINIPRNKMVVLTGVSGSGKSSLAFDTLYAEGQRRYVESLSAYVRRYLDQMDKPKVDYIGGLSPAISIEQKTVSKNPRSTVGTVTEVMDYLRVLFSRAGTQHCPQCGRAVEPVSPQQAADLLSALPGGMRVILMAALTHNKKTDHLAILESARKDGFTRARVDGDILELSEGAKYPKLLKSQSHSIDLLVDRLVVPDTQTDPISRQDFSLRLIDSLETAFRVGKGQIKVLLENGEELILCQTHTCAYCEITLPALTPALFSFNAPSGMCPDCNGLGTKMEVDTDLIVEHADLSLLDGASRWFGNVRKKPTWHNNYLQAIAAHYHTDLELPWKDLPEKFRATILFGSDGEKIQFKYENQDGSWKGEALREERGVVHNINRLFRQTQSEYTRRWYASFMSQQACPTCAGTRLCAEARHVTLGGRGFAEVLEMTIEEAHAWVCGLTSASSASAQLSQEQVEVVGEVLKELRSRLGFMLNVGLHYLSLSRAAPTLSGGEGQRIRLASQLGCGLVGVLYILDEPSIGLHSRDQRSLLTTLLQLRDMGNTVLVVEHDADTMLAADWLIDLGPGAGVMGGRVVSAGTPQQVAADPLSLTGKYLSGALTVSAPNQGKRRPARGWLVISGARLWNLKNVTARFPIGTVTVVTGVSGSGKSSLISDTLYPALARALMGAQATPGPYDRLDGLPQLDKVIDITQDPIGRTPRSNPATYVGIFDEIRAVFASTPEARARGYGAGRFSFNMRGGRCEACQGHGLKRIEMHFLADVWVTCQECKGKRYNRHTLEVCYKGKNIAEVLDMDVQEALEFFSAFAVITRMLQTLHDVGLDYVKLGQSATTLSGGEAQRVKLAKELGRASTGDTIYILDEPTTGLHFADVQRLLDVLHRLADAGNTVVVIEHNLDVIKTADWIVDLGPEGGMRGGYVIAEGTPEEIAQVPESYTGQFLKSVLAAQPVL